MHPETSRESGQHRRTRRTSQTNDSRSVDRFVWERAVRDSPDVTGLTLAVALLAGSYANADGSNIRPAVYTLGQQLGLAVSDDNRCRPVSKHLAHLVELGWLDRTARGSAGRPATYRLTTPDRAPTSTVPTSDRAPTSTVPTSDRAPTNTVTTPDRAHGSTEPCSQEAGNRAPTSTPPSHDQIKTNLSPHEEAPAVMIDPEQIREERERNFSPDHDSPSASGAELVQSVAAADGADPAKWSPEHQERIRDRVARHPELGASFIPLVRPLLLELASRAGSIDATVDAYVSGILSKEDAADQVQRLAEAGQRRMPKTPKVTPLDRLPDHEQQQLRTQAERELLEHGDVPSDWQHASDRDRHEHRIRTYADKLASHRQPVSA